MPTLTTWRWSSWASFALEASLIFGKVRVEMDKDDSLLVERPSHSPPPPFFYFILQCSRSLLDSPTRTLNRLSRKRCLEMWRMPFLLLVNTTTLFFLVVFFHHSTLYIQFASLLIFFSLALICSSQCEEPAIILCRPFVQSHEGTLSYSSLYRLAFIVEPIFYKRSVINSYVEYVSFRCLYPCWPLKTVPHLRDLAPMTERWSASWFPEVKLTFSTSVKSLKKHTMCLCMNSSR